jgi:16S rRNA (guanine527-N7)-methyltransferase
MRMVLEWNRSVSNILSRNDEGRFVERHLNESIAPARSLRGSGARRWVDFGTGAGLPAIPLAIAGIGASWTLVESRRSKTLFLRKTIQVIGLEHFDVIHDRLENVVENPPPSAGWDAFTSRATLTLAPTLKLAAPLVSPGGSAFLWKGSGGEGEMKQDLSWREAWEFSGFIPIGSGPTTVARFTRK